MSRVQSPRQIWGIPTLLGVVSLVGLVAALVADGVGDALSWVALTIPVVISVWGFRRRSAPTPSPSSAPASGGVARPLGPSARRPA